MRRSIVQSVQQAFSEADIKIETATFTLMVGGPQISGSGDQVLSQEELKSILDTNTQSIRNFSFLFANGQLSLGIVRNEGQLRDNVTLHLKNLNQDPAIIKFIKREKLIALVVLTKQHLKELNAQTQLDIIGPQIREHYEIREAELAKLESTLTRIQEEFGRNVAQQRQELESEFKKRREELEQETKELKEQIALQHEQREKELEQEGEKLKKRLAEIDDRESRYVRREIRKDIKNELKNRSEKFQLTEGTRKLGRLPTLS